MMCMNQCDFPDENGGPCRCQLDARNEFEGRLRAAVLARFAGVGAISPELYDAALQDVAKSIGCVVNDGFKAKVAAILKDVPCPLD